MFKKCSIITLLFISKVCLGQQFIDLSNLSSFKTEGKNWQIVSTVNGSFTSNSLSSVAGNGVLFNSIANQAEKEASKNLFTTFEHGDINLSLDFMIPKGSNSGIYLMGRYEVQIYDSWGVAKPKYIDCGGIYERWNDQNPKGQEGYEGQAPRQNACLAPGLWQHLDIEFEAPKFDEKGQKITNALFKKIVLNGILVHENVTVTGPTRAADFTDEKPRGPLSIQGTHGQVAFKNIKYELIDKKGVELGEVSYQYFDKKFDFIPEKIEVPKATSFGKLEKVNYRVAEKAIGFIVKFNGQIIVPENDAYFFSMPLSGNGRLLVDNQVVLNYPNHVQREDTQGEKAVKLNAGKHQFEIWYSKPWNWESRALGLYIRRNGMKKQALHEFVSLPDPAPVGEINIEKAQNKAIIQRSFLMHNGRKRTHVANVSLINGAHLSYDLASGSILKAWRGQFINANEMWHERGEPQLAKPLGVGVDFEGIKDIFILKDSQTDFSNADSLTNTQNLKYLGYALDVNKTPIFKYSTANGNVVTDFFTTNENNTGLVRQIKNSNGNEKTLVQIAKAKNVVDLGNGVFQIDNFYLKTNEKVEIKNVANNEKSIFGHMSNGTFLYEIIW